MISVTILGELPSRNSIGRLLLVEWRNVTKQLRVELICAVKTFVKIDSVVVVDDGHIEFAFCEI